METEIDKARRKAWEKEVKEKVISEVKKRTIDKMVARAKSWIIENDEYGRKEYNSGIKESNSGIIKDVRTDCICGSWKLTMEEKVRTIDA